MVESWKNRIEARARLEQKEKEKKEKIFAAVRQIIRHCVPFSY